jgi:hypothetical protein
MADDVKRIEPTKARGGRWVTLGAEEYRIPPLGFLAIQDLAEDVASLKDIQGQPTPSQMGVVVRIVHAAMRRNYPALTTEDVGDMLDAENFMAVLEAVLNIAGFQASPAGAPQGEAPAAVGAESTPA